MRNKGKVAVFSSEEMERASEYVSDLDLTSKGVGGLVVLLMKELGLRGGRIASLLRISGSSVDRIVSRFRRQQLSVRANPGGGRNHFRMTVEEEAEFLASFSERAQRGELVTIDAFAEALEARFNGNVRRNYVYKLLRRNGWRKVSPDKAHPKNDAAKMDEFKKKHFRARYCWVPPSRT